MNDIQADALAVVNGAVPLRLRLNAGLCIWRRE